MIGPERRYRFKEKPWTLFDRFAVAFLAALIAFFGPIVVFLVARNWVFKWRWAAENASLEPLLWFTAIVTVLAFLATFFDRPHRD